MNFKKLNCNNAVAASLGDKYYLALRIDFNDSNKILCEEENFINNALIVIDVVDNSHQIIRGVDIKNLLPIKTEVFEKMLVIFNSGYQNKVGEIINTSIYMENALPKFWHSGELVEGLKTKLFTKLSVDADKDVKFKLKYDKKEMVFTTYTKGLNEFMFKINCKQIKLEISSINETAEVNNVYLDYYDC